MNKEIEHNGSDKRCTCSACPPNRNAAFWREDEELACERRAAEKALGKPTKVAIKAAGFAGVVKIYGLHKKLVRGQEVYKGQQKIRGTLVNRSFLASEIEIQ